MIAKIMKGTSFSNTINYILDNKKDARIIDHEGVRTLDNQSIADSFSLQSQINNRVTKCVGHIALNFSVEDKSKMTDSLMTKIAKEYLEKMGIVNTQYMIGRHFDKTHPHIHICYNRVDNEGKTISDKNDRFRSSKICKELTLKHGLYYADNSRKYVKSHRLRGAEKARHEIFRTIGESLLLSPNWDKFLFYMKSAEIDVQFKTKGNTNEIQGISFEKDGFKFSGSKVAKQYSYSKLDMKLSNLNTYTVNNKEEINSISLKENRTTNSDRSISIIDIDPTHMYDSNDEPSNKKRRKMGR